MPVLLHVNFNKQVSATRPTASHPTQGGRHRSPEKQTADAQIYTLRLKTWNGGLEVPGIEQVK